MLKQSLIFGDFTNIALQLASFRVYVYCDRCIGSCSPTSSMAAFCFGLVGVFLQVHLRSSIVYSAVSAHCWFCSMLGLGTVGRIMFERG